MTSPSPMLMQYVRKKANNIVNKNIAAELTDPMSVDYYKGYREGLTDSPMIACNEAIELLYEVLPLINDSNLQEKIAKYLKGEM